MSTRETTLGELVKKLSQTNIELWQEEDNARSENKEKVAHAKRAIDKLNQVRNDLIEKIDDYVLSLVKK